ncbi:unnamed protein product [Euphydryas editha]|uniref:Uncharacterized protein n=1 Tax=Euphydryas editha TaxID=104508 RepID=A0AAU9TAH9_EUPED|nr:unnamed protein product [Euphydryas editha]
MIVSPKIRERDIDLIRKNQNHLAALWKNQKSVFEAEFNLLKRTEAMIDESHKLIHKKLNAIEVKLSEN